MFEVIYYSMCGNTRKVAETIADELGVKAESVKTKKEATAGSFLFIGSGSYGSKPGKRVQDFIKRNDFMQRSVALFGTSGTGKGDEVRAMEEMLKSKGALIKGSFHCKGRSLFLFNRGHPTNEELVSARQFAGEMKKL
jgi:flavodoxin